MDIIKKPVSAKTWEENSNLLKQQLLESGILKKDDIQALDEVTNDIAETLLEYLRMFAGPRLYNSLFGIEYKDTAIPRLVNTLLTILLLDYPCKEDPDAIKKELDNLKNINVAIDEEGYMIPEPLDLDEADTRLREMLGLRIPPGMDYPINTDPDAKNSRCKGGSIYDPYTGEYEFVRTTDYDNYMN